MQLLTKLISSLEKCFMDDSMESKTEFRRASILRNERFAFQAALYGYRPSNHSYIPGSIRIDSPLADAVSVFFVAQVPAAMPVYRDEKSLDGYLRTARAFIPTCCCPNAKSLRRLMCTGN